MGALKLCEHCGKRFFHHRESIYRIPSGEHHGTLYYCSYTCWEAGKKEHGYPRHRHNCEKN